MKKYLLYIIGFLSLTATIVYAAPIVQPMLGGTGLSTAPSYGQVLVGNSSSGYTLTATSSLGISGGGGTPAGSDKAVQFNDNGVFGGDPGFFDYDINTGILSVDFLTTPNNITVSGFNKGLIADRVVSNSGTLVLSSSGDAGSVLVEGTAAVTSGFQGGDVTIETFGGVGSGEGGDIDMSAGDGGITGKGGSYNITAGNGGVTSGVGGTIDLSAGNAHSGTNSRGGDIRFTPGIGHGTGSSGGVAIGASTTPWGLLSLNTNAITGPAFVIGSTTGTTFIIDNGGLVGIGTSSPSNTTCNSELLCIDNGGTFGGVGLAAGLGASSVRGYVDADQNFGVELYTSNSFPLSLGTNNTERIRVSSAGLVGIGTTSPYATLSVQSGASTGDAFAVATTSGKAVFGVDNDGHLFTSGPAPAISSCGTGTGTVVGDDESGDITTATAATACTLTFSKAYRNSPVCTVTDNSLVGFADVSSISTSAVTFGISSALTGGHLYYQCTYHK